MLGHVLHVAACISSAVEISFLRAEFIACA